MTNLYERLIENFYRWEIRGRGALVFPGRVLPQPPFAPFLGHKLPELASGKDSARQTKVSGLFKRIKSLLRDEGNPRPASAVDSEEEIEPSWLSKDSEVTEIPFLLPTAFDLKADGVEAFLSSLSLVEDPLTFEVVGRAGRVWAQWVADEQDASEVRKQMTAQFPTVVLPGPSESLTSVWMEADEEEVLVEFGLEREFMWPLGNSRSDPFVSLIATLSGLVVGEVAVYQVIFTPLWDAWAEAINQAVTKPDGKPFFSDGADLVKASREKTARPLYGAVVRLATKSSDLSRAWQLVRSMAASLRSFARIGGNALTPLDNEFYDPSEHTEDLLARRTCRAGMLLNLDELIGFVHFPSSAVRSAAFARIGENTRSAKFSTSRREGVLLGKNEHAGDSSEIWVTDEQRTRHLHVLGASGYGKTTLLFNLLRQDLEQGKGLALLDPHGDLADKILGVIPRHRIDDVIVIDPSDEQFIVPFNVLQAHTEFEKTLLSSDLVAIFRSQSTSWGDQMNSVFGNAIRTFLESDVGGTLADVRRFLLDSSWRDKFLETVADAELQFYWRTAFPQLGGNRSIGPILTRLETFLAPKPIRFMVSQHENRIDFSDIMDTGKILVAKLPQGLMGKENSYLLGSLIVAKAQQMAMSRQRMDQSKRRDFFFYVDEAHNFLCPSMGEILSGGRKYRMGLILAHQDLRQLDREKEVASAVMSNAFTRVVFRVSDSDARTLADGFAHFEPKHFQSLEIGQALCRVERADNDFNLSVLLEVPVDEAEAAERRGCVIRASREKVALPRDEVAAVLSAKTDATPKKSKVVAATVQVIPISKTEAEHPSLKQQGEIQDQPSDSTATLLQETSKADDGPRLSEVQGKGGHQSKLVIERLKKVAQEKGFRVVIEMPIGPSGESVDVAFLREDLRIACEISVSTTVDHEVGNVRKCLREQFEIIAIVCADERKLSQIEEAVRGHCDPQDAGRVRFFTPEGAFGFINGLPQAQKEDPDPVQVRRGYKVTRRFIPLPDEERARIGKVAFELLKQEMKLPPPE